MKKIITLSIIFVSFTSAIFLVYYFYPINKKQARVELTSDEVIRKVSMMVELPKDENPTVATVSNIETLKDQPFFEKASLGDKVLIYSVSGKVILYSPSRDIILNVSPLRFEPSN